MEGEEECAYKEKSEGKNKGKNEGKNEGKASGKASLTFFSCNGNFFPFIFCESNQFIKKWIMIMI